MTSTNTDKVVDPTEVTVNVYRYDQIKPERVDLNLANGAHTVPGYKYQNPTGKGFCTVPAFFIDAVKKVEAEYKEISKNDFQDLMRNLAIEEGLPESKSRQYYARWAEMSCLGYAQNPGWIAWFNPHNEGNSRFYKPLGEGQPVSGEMLTRENSPNYGKGGKTAKKKKLVSVRQLAEQLKALGELNEEQLKALGLSDNPEEKVEEQPKEATTKEELPKSEPNLADLLSDNSTEEPEPVEEANPVVEESNPEPVEKEEGSAPVVRKSKKVQKKQAAAKAKAK